MSAEGSNLDSGQANVTLVPKPAFWDNPDNLSDKYYKMYFDGKLKKDAEFLTKHRAAEEMLESQKNSFDQYLLKQRRHKLRELKEHRKAERILLQSSSHQRLDGAEITQDAENLLREMSVDQLSVVKLKRSGFRTGLQVPAKDGWNRVDLLSQKSAELLHTSKTIKSDMHAVRSIENKIKKELLNEIGQSYVKKHVHDIIKNQEKNMKFINDMKRARFERLGVKLKGVRSQSNTLSKSQSISTLAHIITSNHQDYGPDSHNHTGKHQRPPVMVVDHSNSTHFATRGEMDSTFNLTGVNVENRVPGATDRGEKQEVVAQPEEHGQRHGNRKLWVDIAKSSSPKLDLSVISEKPHSNIQDETLRATQKQLSVSNSTQGIPTAAQIGISQKAIGSPSASSKVSYSYSALNPLKKPPRARHASPLPPNIHLNQHSPRMPTREGLFETKLLYQQVFPREKLSSQHYSLKQLPQSAEISQLFESRHLAYSRDFRGLITAQALHEHLPSSLPLVKRLHKFTPREEKHTEDIARVLDRAARIAGAKGVPAEPEVGGLYGLDKVGDSVTRLTVERILRSLKWA